MDKSTVSADGYRTKSRRSAMQRVWVGLLAASDAAPRKKPATLSYGREEVPPAVVTWMSAVQHVGVIAIFLVYPLIIARQAGLTPDETTNLLQLAIVVMAIAVVLQALPRGPVGSRFLAPSIFTGVYLAPSLLAVKSGGLPLVWGMTIFAGFVEIALSRVWSGCARSFRPNRQGSWCFSSG
jgi:xanthine permease XanP